MRATTARERALAPDVARGLALLGIALANGVVHITGRTTGVLAKPVDGSAGDRLVDTLVGLLVDNRAFPMFTLLFAYGTVVILRRSAERGLTWPEARGLLLRRNAWLAVVGVAHLVLLFFGDILLSYGLLGLLLVAVVRWPDTRLRTLGWATLPLFVGLSALDGLGGATGVPAGLPGRETFVGDLLWRGVTLVSSVFSAPLVVGALLPPAVIGILLARRRVLEQPADHLPLLRRLVLVGFPVSVVGGVPAVLAATGAVELATGWDVVVAALHGLTGLAGAVAFTAAVAWWSTTVGPRGPGVVARAARAVGRRSLTCYLLQSVLFVPLLSAWALGLGAGAGTATVSLVAVGVYAVTVLVAVVLDRLDLPGPAERLLRRLTYGQPPVGAGAEVRP
ncbi:DUF418 domain-containing protein [Aquipuribacter nitratireducens]|uniref:DUF418 domain-containing protein n=1 Tax=Aquipuribacter nitratireducens TaxID=650104 RepID=A0ABW0GMV4_9MICO